MNKFINDFKSFAIKGNMIDLAVGVIIGGAFGKIVSSLVNDIIMPPLGVLIGGVDFVDLKLIIKQAVIDASGAQVTPAVTLNYGNFFQVLFDFLIIAFTIFMVVRTLMKLKKKEEAAPAAPPAPSKEQQLLTEIRDLLKEKK